MQQVNARQPSRSLASLTVLLALIMLFVFAVAVSVVVNSFLTAAECLEGYWKMTAVTAVLYSSVFSAFLVATTILTYLRNHRPWRHANPYVHSENGLRPIGELFTVFIRNFSTYWSLWSIGERIVSVMVLTSIPALFVAFLLLSGLIGKECAVGTTVWIPTLSTLGCGSVVALLFGMHWLLIGKTHSQAFQIRNGPAD